jgi:transposase
LLQWARGLDEDHVWALEDCRHVSGSLERFLIERGERVLRIPTHLTAKARKSARQRGKSDPIDALNVARAALQEGLDAFPAAHLDGPELDLRLLVDHRERLVRHRVELNSTLCGSCTISGRRSSCRVGRCSRRSGARGSAGVWPTPNRRCAFASLATSCAACAS